jgi:signal transduction histidine kinase
MFAGRNEAPEMPAPPGHREIQDEELSRLFGQAVGARLLALPLVGAFALWLAWIEPAIWRKVILAALVPALFAFFFGEWLRWRRHGFTAGAVPRNLFAATCGLVLIIFATGGLASPFVYVTIPLAIVTGLFVAWPANAILVATLVIAVWTFAIGGANGAIPDLNLAVFGGGPRIGAPPAYLYTHAGMLTFLYATASLAGLAVRHAFERIVRRALAAQQESLETHAQRAEELTAMSAEIAHELKNPLASVKGLAGLLAQSFAQGKEAERIAVLRREVDRMQVILDEFLNFSRPLVPLALGESDVTALCHEVAALHEGLAREREAQVIVRGDAVSTRCDPRKVKQILINLVQNALDATPRGATVEIEAERPAGGGARIRILDRGRGLEPAVVAALFSPGATTKPRGSGLGLVIARALARQHGGELALSPREGGGTVAEVVLPERPAEAGGGRAA